ncbi:Carbohydrate diacid regulator [Moorella thermoacetica]|uniref:Carbohydrate diacid regulator n=1 Tax=Neomoorella thermoacetica TaxID=1525 RepID=A0AAC9MVY7_NEOTH|nr:sugar diacid recognition domain-containing protein [Moorella thermoacetica]AOQ25320.1 Carbohydrate diacid regulator [Moorella thermoacetica]TYL11881.1 Carbohydrate diacid regulator [Moorella thermoacetica]
MSQLMLSANLAQKIVKKIMGTLGKNINIMDAQGRIIASGNPRRVGEKHRAAFEASSKGEPIIVRENDMNMFGVKYQGVNMPIRFKGTVVGVIGVTGNPDEILSYVELVRDFAEMMIEEAVLREQFYLETQALESFIQKLVAGETKLSEEEIIDKAELFGIDYHISRSVCLFLTYPLNDGNNMVEQNEHKFLSILQASFKMADGEILVRGGAGKFILLKKGVKDIPTFLAQLNTLCDKLTIESKLAVSVGIGSFGPNLAHVIKSYEEALKAVTIGRQFYPQLKVFNYDDLKVERVIWEVPPAKRKNFIDEILGALIEEDTFHHRQLYSTMEAFFKNDLDIERTAKALHVHRNTIIYRLKKIKECTGYDPRGSFRELLHLGMAYLFYKCDGNSAAVSSRN